ncbi:MAG: TIGR02281 family clan AA aspartic protease [Hyphomicrobium sp.]|jgi:aspartyl protease family protein|nr:TIGR02281 family clan AA aspartic protease [Hyphomicrobium sp.]PPD08412.1 MAG: TIGR02281 family clan AA aspartic protease [Hyphomicrobium sp.]
MFFAGVMVVCITHFDELKAAGHRLIGTDPAVLAAIQQNGAPVEEAVAPQPAATDGYTFEVAVGPDGHYHVDAEINGRSVAVLVDTGASVVALTADDADTAGIFVRDRDFTGRIQTANGSARVAPVVLDEVTIGDITVRDVRAVVSEPGALSVSLLGMTFLNQLDRVDMRSGKLILQD